MNRARGERTKHGLRRLGDEPEKEQEEGILGVADYRPERVPSKTWRQLIQKVWEVDPLTCPRCGGMMKVIALIEEPAVVRRILEHLELWRAPEARRGDLRGTTPSEAAEAPPDFAYEPVDDGWAVYEVPTYAIH